MAPTEVDFRCQANVRGTDRRCKWDSLPGSSYCKYHRYKDAGCYKIKLTSDKWYVGFSRNVRARINEHRESIVERDHRTPQWIIEHPPADPFQYEILRTYNKKLPMKSNWGNIDDTIILTFWVTGAVFVAVCLFMSYCLFPWDVRNSWSS